jgi:peptidoglycan/xylan/chitin deacetylase (PgdA/CDA1 family)
MHFQIILLAFFPLCTSQFLGYSCPSTCQPPACTCASQTPPVSDPPQFLLLTFDDAIQESLMPQIESLLNRNNPNGCQVQTTFFAQAAYTDPYLLTKWYANGHEVADHSFTHTPPFAGSQAEIDGMRQWASAFGGIPTSAIKGVRFPFRNYTRNSLELISRLGFEYDSSMASHGNPTWPYTLDYGAVNDCMTSTGICNARINAQGLWVI